MIISKVEIVGLRGFATKQEINIAIPGGTKGSGLTIIVGPNNSGKSTIIEAITAFATENPPSLPEGKRNILSDKKVEIKIFNPAGESIILKTTSARGSETVFEEVGIGKRTIKPFVIPSRRMFSPFFGKGLYQRDDLIGTRGLPAQRGQEYGQFSNRLFKMQNDQKSFNEILEKVIGICPEWYIEQNDAGQHYLKFLYDQTEHNSDGAGEGLLSIFTIIDALYDSQPGDLIVIDEPELSVHPSAQKKLIELFADYAKDRQIIVSTHSPYFIDWESIVNGAVIVRVIKEETSSKIYQLSPETVGLIGNSLQGINNPHVFGLVANEVFFLNENIILVEGQEDVVVFKKILANLGILLKGEFYGWGVGGAENMKNIAAILKNLGFKKVIGILDNNKKQLQPQLSKDFLEYRFVVIPADDVRDKVATNAKPAIVGLATTAGEIKEEYKESVSGIFNEANNYFNLKV